MPQTKIPASRDCGSRSYNGFGVGTYACVCDESQICYHMTWQKMFNSCTCAKFRQILLDVSNKMFQVNIQCQTNAYNNFPHWLSLLCGILDAFSPYRFLSFAHTHILRLCQRHLPLSSSFKFGWPVLLTSIAQLFVCIQSFKESIHSHTGPYHNRTNLNRKPQTQCSLILGKPFEVEWMSK